MKNGYVKTDKDKEPSPVFHFKVAAIVFIVSALLSIPGAFLYKKISARYVQNHTPAEPGPEPESENGSAPENQ